MAASSEEGEVVHAGLLLKQGKVIKNWKLRWFELTDHNVLRYYRSATSKSNIKLRGSLDLTECSDICCYDQLYVKWPVTYPPAKNPANCFGFTVGERTFYLVAQRPEDCKTWMTALRKHSPNLSMFRGRVMQPSKRRRKAAAQEPEFDDDDDDDAISVDEESPYVNADWDTASVASAQTTDHYVRIKRLLRKNAELDMQAGETAEEERSRLQAEAIARQSLLDMFDGDSDSPGASDGDAEMT